MIGIVVASILLTTVGIIVVAGKQAIEDSRKVEEINALTEEILAIRVSI